MPDESGSSVNRRALIRAVAISAVFVSWAPFIGEIRLALRNAFPATFIPAVAITMAVALVVPCLIVVYRIRTRRLLRYSSIAAALTAVVVYWLTMRTGILEVDSVELFHFLQYGAVGTLFYLAFLPVADVTIVLLAILCGAIVGTTEEWVQWLVPTRVGEARDVYLDALAVGCGVLFGIGLRPPDAWMRSIRAASWVRLARLTAFAVVFFAVFYHLAHLGYDIRDPQIGSFYSSYTEEELQAVVADRAAKWRANPPIALKPLAIEDFYLTEAASHVYHRNAYYEARHFDLAWKENLILEKYYGPFLDLRSFSSGVLHRWPAAQRAEVEAKRGPESAGLYESAAGRERIVVVPTKTQFWTAVAGIVAILLFVAFGFRRKPITSPVGSPVDTVAAGRP